MQSLSTEAADPIELMYQTGWTDGLPVVPPSRGKVEQHIAASGRAGDELIAEIPPLGGKATVERLAVNSVMAGWQPRLTTLQEHSATSRQSTAMPKQLDATPP